MRIMLARELASRLGVPERDLSELARQYNLAFTVSGVTGLGVSVGDLILWEAAALRDRRRQGP
jgi:hypothetical protein